MNPPPSDPTTQWVQAGRKVDFAITQTKSMIQKARGASYLPDLHMRLAELYTERARYAWLSSTSAGACAATIRVLSKHPRRAC
jgi:hypothetical protein